MGYKDPRDAIQRHVSVKYKLTLSDIRGGYFTHPFENGEIRGGIQPNTLFLSEPGFYELAFSSKLHLAVMFRDWVFSEVLPSIRKTGSYTMNGLCNTLGTMTLSVLSSGDRNQLTEYKTILKTHENILKDPTKVEMGRRGGLRCQGNRRGLANRVKEYEGVIKQLRSLLEGLKHLN